jgi:hypothetical protein
LQSAGSLDIAAAVVNHQTNLSGFDNSRVSFTSQQLLLDWNGLPYLDGQKIVVDFDFQQSPVPERLTLALTAHTKPPQARVCKYDGCIATIRRQPATA